MKKIGTETLGLPKSWRRIGCGVGVGAHVLPIFAARRQDAVVLDRTALKA